MTTQTPAPGTPGAEDFLCACCDQDFAAHAFDQHKGKRYSPDPHCEGWTPYPKPPPWTPDPTNGCHLDRGLWRHGCKQPSCVCSCHAPRQLHPELGRTPSATCGWSTEDYGPRCPEPAHYVVGYIDEHGRRLVELGCEAHLIDVLQAATVVYPTHPIQVSLTVIDESCWQLGREAWRGERRLREHQGRAR